MAVKQTQKNDLAAELHNCVHVDDGRTRSALEWQAGGSHYKGLKIQPIEYIHANGLDFFQGNIVKYATRYKAKNGAEDLRKVIHYAQLALQLQYGDQPEQELMP